MVYNDDATFANCVLMVLYSLKLVCVVSDICNNMCIHTGSSICVIVFSQNLQTLDLIIMSMVGYQFTVCKGSSIVSSFCFDVDDQTHCRVVLGNLGHIFGFSECVIFLLRHFRTFALQSMIWNLLCHKAQRTIWVVHDGDPRPQIH